MNRDQVPGGLLSRTLAPLLILAAAGGLSACGSASSSKPAAAVPAAGSAQAPGTVLANWIHAVAAGQTKAACQDMGKPGVSPQRFLSTCLAGSNPVSPKTLHSEFTSSGISANAPVSAAATVKGSTATASGTDVRVGGKTLTSVIASHSTGLKPGQLKLGFKLSRIDGAWYVTDMSMNM